MKLMVVDDSQPVRQLIRVLLSSLPLDICECESGESALDCYRQHQPDCVLMDLEMKEVNGLQATEQIRASFPQANVVIVTSFDDPVLRLRAREAGASGYVVKAKMTELPLIIQGLPSSQNLI